MVVAKVMTKLIVGISKGAPVNAERIIVMYVAIGFAIDMLPRIVQVFCLSNHL